MMMTACVPKTVNSMTTYEMPIVQGTENAAMLKNANSQVSVEAGPLRNRGLVRANTPGTFAQPANSASGPWGLRSVPHVERPGCWRRYSSKP
ncbi:hypothetical protein VTH06DRAFT_3930 [Thermothelomyces fergusii]